MGDGGPIPNPKKIRYLPPSEVSAGSVGSIGPSLLSGALATTQVLMQAVEVGASIHNAIKLRQIESYLSSVLTGIEQIKSQFESISGRLNLIIRKVDAVQKMQAERYMRDNLEFLLEKKYVAQESVDLDGLAGAVLEVISRYEEMGGVDIQLGGERSLQLSVETRDLLSRVYCLFHSIRRSAYGTINRKNDGNPLQTVNADLQDDYWPSHVAPYNMMLLAIKGMHWGQKRAVRDYIGDHVTRIFSDADSVAMRLRPFFYEMDETLMYEDYKAFKRWWVWKTDAGLLHRVRKEAKGIAEGYAPTFDVDTQALPNHEEGGLFHLAAPNDDSKLQEVTSELATSTEAV
ncbi:hypothetical protein GGP50_001746 [Salinibacter ruber]|uniref:hypothetical protein n=1 Tax=Salinibacter ruber TaxID=146919 RepID=UPI00216747F1|nr:hypothetical protein [Salinibacter ruber]MCS4193525.1 hypothetical protein [Salinibacter ruber]